MARLFPILLCFLLSFASTKEVVAQSDASTFRGQPNDMLCGVRSLYGALQLLDARTDWYELKAAFPGAAEKGTSLAQLSEYLMKKGFYCKYARIGKSEIQAMDKSLIAFVLTQNKNTAHIHLLHKLNSETIQEIDAPKEPVDIKIASLGSTYFDCLLVARDKDALPSGKHLWQQILALGLICGGVVLVGSAIMKGKK